MENIIKKKWLERFESLPLEIQNKINEYYASSEIFQLNKQKGSRKYPEIGEIFEISVLNDLRFKGIVLNNHINSMNGDDLLVICIFKADVDIEDCIKNTIKDNCLLIEPVIVGKEYWSRGYFHKIGEYTEKINISSYSFFDVIDNKFYDEYGNDSEMKEIVSLYGVATITGIGTEIGIELIIQGLM